MNATRPFVFLGLSLSLLLVSCGGGVSTNGATSFIAGNGAVTFIESNSRVLAPKIEGAGAIGTQQRHNAALGHRQAHATLKAWPMNGILPRMSGLLTN